MGYTLALLIQRPRCVSEKVPLPIYTEPEETNLSDVHMMYNTHVIFKTLAVHFNSSLLGRTIWAILEYWTY